MKHWLLEETVLQTLEQAHKAGVKFSADELAQFEARVASRSAATSSPLLTVSAGEAVIAVEGVITQKPDIFALLFGGGNTTYSEIVAAVTEADANPDVKQITLDIDSPGGQFDGLFDALDAIDGASKPSVARVGNLAASAAYAIASQADSIVATSRAARFGSIGVAASFPVSDRVVTISSTEAPNKRPDVSTPEGQAVVREQLDEMHELFVSQIADGRGTTVKAVNRDFGRGSTMLAEGALKNGMIDTIEAAAPVVAVDNTKPSAHAGAKNAEVKVMDIETLKAQHPGVYDAILAQGHQQGVTAERDRVGAHLKLGNATGALDLAVKHITDGTEFGATVSADYLAAQVSNRDLDAQAADNTDAGEGTEHGAESDENDGQAEAAGAAVLAEAAAMCGVTVSV